MKKIFLPLLLAALSMVQAWADEAFRLHRYSSFQATPVTSDEIVFIGNSITNMHPWAEAFNAEGLVNRGNSGGFSYEILDNIQSFISGRPRKAFIMIGTNDMGADGTAQSVAWNVKQAVKHIQRESPETQIYIESIMPSMNGKRSLERCAECNEALQQVAQEMGVPFINIYDGLMGITTYELSYDNLHPHVVGNRIWMETLAPYVEAESQYPDSVTVYNGGMSNSYGARLSSFGQLPIGADDVLFIGDEFVHTGEWQELLGNPLVKNRGTGWGYWGPSIAFQTASVPYILRGLESNQEPRQILLYAGSQALGKKDSLQTIQQDYKELVDTVRHYAPNAKLSLVSILPTEDSEVNAGYVKPFNAWLESFAQEIDNCHFIDFYTTMSDGMDGINAAYMVGNYPYGLGYQACARILAEHIEGCHVMSEQQAEDYYNLMAARTRLSREIDAAERLLSEGNLDERSEAYKSLISVINEGYALLAKDDATAAECDAISLKLFNYLGGLAIEHLDANLARL